jgi:hypothetical protein
MVLSFTLATAFAQAESLPLFFKSTYGDERDEIARKGRKFNIDDPAWQPVIKPIGESAGETSVVVRFPAAAKAYPIRFGIPLGQVSSCSNVAVYDEDNQPVAADVFPLVNFKSCPQHWVMIATVLDAPSAGDRRLTIKWGPDVCRPDAAIRLNVEKSDDSLVVRGGRIGFSLSPKTLLSDIVPIGDETVFAEKGSFASFTVEGQSQKKHRPGKIVTLFDGPSYKHFRVESSILNDQFKIHCEVQTWADSPYLFISTRFINENDQAYQLSDLQPIALAPHGAGYVPFTQGPDGGLLKAERHIAVIQRVDDWGITGDHRNLAKGQQDAPSDWVKLSSKTNSLILIVPDFQDFGPGDPDLQSSLTGTSDGRMTLNHYNSYPADAGGTITFWGTTARTFRMVLHVGPNSLSPESVIDIARQQPHIIYDRQFLTAQGVFNEDRVTDIYAEPSLEAARYFNRTRANRHDYPRMGRGMPPHKSEGEYHPYTDTGGMLFGEVWQYASTNPASVAGTLARAREPEGNLPAWYKPLKHEGTSTYRCGDHTLALALSYLRTGDREVFEIFDDHSLLYADWAIAHPEGYCHYYCSWQAGVHVYSRLGGPLISYLIQGDPWFYEVAEQMAGHLVRSWNGNDHPRDQQTRSAYPVRGLTWLYEVNGHRSYWNNAVDLTVWFMQTGLEPDGSVRGFANHSGYHRISPLYAGYTLCGLMPLYERCPNPELLEVIRRCGEWLLTCQGTMQDKEGAGTWPRDTVIRERMNLGPGNVGSATLCAEIQTYLAQETGDQRFFYSSAAAWANLVTSTRHRQIKGGLSMQLGSAKSTGTWSDKFPIYLHRLPAVAEQLQLPFVLEGVYDGDPDRASPVIVFVAAGGTFENDVLRQPLYAANQSAVTIPVWCPRQPVQANYAGRPIAVEFGNNKKSAYVALPPNSEPGELRVVFKPR